MTKVPSGEAPLEIRAKWFGLVLPINAIHNWANLGALSGKNHGGIVYSVPQEEALAILSKKCSNAALWWSLNGYPKSGHNFCFQIDEAEIVGVLNEELPVVDVVKMFTGILEVGVGAHDHFAITQG